MKKQYKPNLAPNEEINLDNIKYPIFASTKLDGIRCIIHPDLGLVSRSLKPIQNKQLNEKFQSILDVAKEFNVIFDGEIYAHNRTFQEITRAVMTQDFDDEKTIKKISKEIDDYKNYVKDLVDSMGYFCFDVLINDDSGLTVPFECRVQSVERYMRFTNNRNFWKVEQKLVNSPEEVKEYFKECLDNDYEGLILKNPMGLYKFGRSTVNEANCYKVKPYIEKSAIIKGVVQATRVDENAEKTINELGRSVTSKKKDDRVLINKAAAFLVDYEGKDLKVVIAATDAEKSDIWEERDLYVGCEVLFKAMDVGAKDLPRHPVTVRWYLKNE